MRTDEDRIDELLEDDSLTKWERSFLESLRDQLDNEWEDAREISLTEAQKDKLKEIERSHS